MDKKRIQKDSKSTLHPLNKHRQRYDFKALTKSCPALIPFVHINKFNDETIDFFNPEAVKALNKALLLHHYNIKFWDIPKNYLCPPIPGRADYIHHIATHLAEYNNGKIPKGNQIQCLDIGTGANCIYPILGTVSYDWSFIASDIDTIAVENAKNIIAKNENLKNRIDIRLQANPKAIFKGVLNSKERIHITFCNPPFHASAAEAQAGTLRKLKNLRGKKPVKANLNFGGQANELWCKGGEKKFIKMMVKESKQFSNSCLWFSTLVSKETNLPSIYDALQKVNASTVKTIPMGQGNKKSRIVAWSFLSKKQLNNSQHFK